MGSPLLNRICLVLSFFCMALGLSAQISTVSGIVVQRENGLGLEGAIVKIEGDQTSTVSSVTGSFTLLTRLSGDQTLIVIKPGYKTVFLPINVGLNEGSLIEVIMEVSDFAEIDDLSLLPTFSLENDDADFPDGTGGQEISSILTASRDVFVSTASFVFASARFRIRGYNPEYSNLSLNGVPFNDPETGIPFFWQMGGLNDVLRARDINIGLMPVNFTFGEIGGSSNIDLRPSRQWAQTRISYALSNRSYRQRIMLTHSSGMNKKGWAYSMSFARRWANEGYIPGTFFDGYSYYAGLEKKFNDRHSLSLVVFGAPTVRGGSTPAIQEMYDLAGTNFYNPSWGWQNGRKRNARVNNSHMPMAILRHDFNINAKTIVTTCVSYQTGRNGFGALGWDEAGDPRPDYYQKLPSFQQDPELAAQLADFMRQNPELLQLDWNSMYNANRNNLRTIQDAEGISGNDVTGNLAKYFLEERRVDNSTLNGVVLLEHYLTDRITINAGGLYRHFQGENFRMMQDLLGADFYINEDRFTRIDFPNDPSKWENDTDNPRRLIRVGDRFGYDYIAHIRQYQAWLQGTVRLRRWDFFLSGRADSQNMWREGRMRNGRFPENSLGESERVQFANFSLKGGLTFKIDGRQYLYANAYIGSQAPLYRTVFVSARTRNEVNPHVRSENISSLEGGYLFRSPKMKARIGAFITQFKNQTINLSYFQDAGVDFDDDGEEEGGGIVNFILYDVSRQHAGLEAALEYNLSPSWSISAVASVGDFIFNDRPKSTIILDNSSTPIASDMLIYARNFFVSRSPQQAYSIGINYRSRKFWYVNMNINYFSKNYVEFNPVRRTVQAVKDLEADNPQRRLILEQERLPDALTIDIFGGKSWKIKSNFVYLNVGVGNLLNNTRFITSGFEQPRFDFRGQNPNRFPPRYFYAFGFNYFVNLAYRF